MSRRPYAAWLRAAGPGFESDPRPFAACLPSLFPVSSHCIHLINPKTRAKKYICKKALCLLMLQTKMKENITQETYNQELDIHQKDEGRKLVKDTAKWPTRKLKELQEFLVSTVLLMSLMVSAHICRDLSTILGVIPQGEIFPDWLAVVPGGYWLWEKMVAKKVLHQKQPNDCFG